MLLYPARSEATGRKPSSLWLSLFLCAATRTKRSKFNASDLGSEISLCLHGTLNFRLSKGVSSEISKLEKTERFCNCTGYHFPIGDGAEDLRGETGLSR